MRRLELKTYFTAFVLAAALVAVTQNQGFAAGKAVTKGASVLEGAQKNVVWFGTYQQASYDVYDASTIPDDNRSVAFDNDENGTKYFHFTPAQNGGPENYSITPIKWRVLSTTPNGKIPGQGFGDAASCDQTAYDNLSRWGDGDGVFLFSDLNIDAVRYNENSAYVTWETCTLRSWLNGYAASANEANADYSTAGKSFISTAFDGAEQNALLPTVVENAKNPFTDAESGAHTSDKIFALSVYEISSDVYGFNDAARIGLNTAYVYAGGSNVNPDPMVATAGMVDTFWLRTTGISNDFAAFGSTSGLPNDPVEKNCNGNIVNSPHHAVRPALNVNAQNIIFTTAAAGGKKDETGASLAANEELSAASEDLGFKFTLASAGEMTGSVASGDTDLAEMYDAQTLAIRHKALGAFTEASYDHVTAALTSGDEILYYGAINDDTSATLSTVTIPSGLAAGAYKLLIYAERRSKDYYTDYASETPLEINLSVSEYNAVTVSGSFAAASGAGSYAKGQSVLIDAGSRAGYTFSGWSSSPDVTFANASSARTTFIMPGFAVEITALWSEEKEETPKTPAESGEIKITGARIEASETNRAPLRSGVEIRLFAVVTPPNATEKLYWKSSDASVATVTDGVVKARAAGVVVITLHNSKGELLDSRSVTVCADDGSSGGCSTGGFGALSLFAIALAVRKRRK